MRLETSLKIRILKVIEISLIVMKIRFKNLETVWLKDHFFDYPDLCCGLQGKYRHVLH